MGKILDSLRKGFGSKKEQEAPKKEQEGRGPAPRQETEDEIQLRQILNLFDQMSLQADACKAAGDQERLQQISDAFETLVQKGMGLQAGEAEKAAFAEKLGLCNGKLREAHARVEQAEREAEQSREERREQKLTDAKKNIAEARKTPLETLIARTKDKDVGALRPQGAEETEADKEQEAAPNGLWEEIKRRGSEIPGEIADGFKEAFSGPAEFLKAFSDKFESASEMFGTAADLNEKVGELGGSMEAAKEMEGKKAFKHDVKDGKKETGEFSKKDAVSVIKMACTLVNSALHLIKMIQTFVEIGKKEMENNSEAPTLDGQERHKMARDALHQIVGLFGDATSIASGFIEAVPLLGPVLEILKGGLEMAMDTWDMASDSCHVEMMRRERNLIYERMQAKREKYSQEKTKDEQAAEAYTIEGKWFQSRAADVDDKRKEMLRTVALSTQNDPDKIRIVQRKDMRSRNDSRYREAQYGLGQRIREKKLAPGKKSKEEKTKLRQMEALEMMEKFREAEKAHKRMRKSVMLKVEAIIKGAVGLVSSGLTLAGQIAAMTGVGAGAGAGLIGASTVIDVASLGYDAGRVGVTGAYHGVRKLIGTEANKDTTRSDMALVIMDRMKEVSASEVWDDRHFADDTRLEQANAKDVIRQGENVRQLKSLLRGGLDASMSDLIGSDSAKNLQKGLAGAFGQG